MQIKGLFTLLFTGYPIYDASSVALNTVRRWLEHDDEKGNKHADLVCFALYVLSCMFYLSVIFGQTEYSISTYGVADFVELFQFMEATNRFEKQQQLQQDKKKATTTTNVFNFRGF